MKTLRIFLVHLCVCITWAATHWWRIKRKMMISTLIGTGIFIGGLTLHLGLISWFPSWQEILGDPINRLWLHGLYSVGAIVVVGLTVFIVFLIFAPSQIYAEQLEKIQKLQHAPIFTVAFERQQEHRNSMRIIRVLAVIESYAEPVNGLQVKLLKVEPTKNKERQMLWTADLVDLPLCPIGTPFGQRKESYDLYHKDKIRFPILIGIINTAKKEALIKIAHHQGGFDIAGKWVRTPEAILHSGGFRYFVRIQARNSEPVETSFLLVSTKDHFKFK
jgi:hypothetical protein